jgi:hypothetical protein
MIAPWVPPATRCLSAVSFGAQERSAFWRLVIRADEAPFHILDQGLSRLSTRLGPQRRRFGHATFVQAAYISRKNREGSRMPAKTHVRIFMTAALAFSALPALADVTINATTAGKASIINVGGDSVTQIKGNRLRTEQTVRGSLQVLIIDIDGRRFINLDDRKRTAEVTPLDSISEHLQKIVLPDIGASLEPTSEVKKVAGFSCTVHNINMSFPFSLTGQPGQGMDTTMVMSGTVCLSGEAPGLADYQRFYKAAADSGFIFGDPRAAKSPAGAAQARAYAAITRKMAEAGMALESHINISATGGGPLAAMMAGLAKSNFTTTVTQVAEGSLEAAAFDIPAGYKVKTQN